MLVTIIGVSASRVAVSEAVMTRNEIIFKRNFYLAEGAALEAVDHLNRYGNLRDNHKKWMEMGTDKLTAENVNHYWTKSVAAGDTVIPEPGQVNPERTLFLIAHDGIGTGSSLDMSKPTIHFISVYSRCDWDGTSIIKIGYCAPY
jgi:hypothetical protein